MACDVSPVAMFYHYIAFCPQSKILFTDALAMTNHRYSQSTTVKVWSIFKTLGPFSLQQLHVYASVQCTCHFSTHIQYSAVVPCFCECTGQSVSWDTACMLAVQMNGATQAVGANFSNYFSPPTHLPQCQLSQNPTTEKHRKAINCNGQTPNDCYLHKNARFKTVVCESKTLNNQRRT